MITIELFKKFIWIVFITCWMYEFGVVLRAFKFDIIGTIISGVSAIFLLAEGMLTVPMIYWFLFVYWR